MANEGILSAIGVTNPFTTPVNTSLVDVNSIPTVVNTAPVVSDTPNFLNTVDKLTLAFQRIANGVHPTVTVKGDLAGTLYDAKQSLPWWLVPLGGVVLLMMLFKPSAPRRYGR
ncbi:MAG TPA: hypothetical protein VHA56_03155 [Mucilaginibacter sp.]|nr:hypothetical protein [Mucilaginibacter sp.]